MNPALSIRSFATGFLFLVVALFLLACFKPPPAAEPVHAVKVLTVGAQSMQSGAEYALMGMIQRNSVILIDQIEQDRASGVPAWDAIVESTVRRARPIMLTAAAVLAMIPLSRSVFWGPMPLAIMDGLMVATVLTLLTLPAMYAAWFGGKNRQQVKIPG